MFPGVSGGDRKQNSGALGAALQRVPDLLGLYTGMGGPPGAGGRWRSQCMKESSFFPCVLTEESAPLSHTTR